MSAVLRAAFSCPPPCSPRWEKDNRDKSHLIVLNFFDIQSVNSQLETAFIWSTISCALLVISHILRNFSRWLKYGNLVSVVEFVYMYRRLLGVFVCVLCSMVPWLNSCHCWLCVYQPDGKHRGQWHWHIASRWACWRIHSAHRDTHTTGTSCWYVNRWSEHSNGNTEKDQVVWLFKKKSPNFATWEHSLVRIKQVMCIFGIKQLAVYQLVFMSDNLQNYRKWAVIVIVTVIALLLLF